MIKEQPNMMTVREIARTGLLSGKLPAIYIGNKALINYDKLCEQLSALEADVKKEPEPTWY